ncbi:MAG TPA: Pycsar system effector family protein [Chitinophagaceae bacterium]
MNYSELLKKIVDHVNSFYIDHNDARLCYHNYTHANDAVDAAKKIADHYQLNERDWFIVCAATWFHDTGYLVAEPRSHEEKSAEIAENFLKSIEVGTEDIDAIKKCILATKIPQSPVSLVEKIVCDADLFYLGTNRFKEYSRLSRKELETLQNTKIDGDAWRKENIKMLETHRFHTDYCRLLLEQIKNANTERLKRKQQEKISGAVVEAGKNNTIKKEDNKDKTPKTRTIKKLKTNRHAVSGIQTMFRLSSSNSQRISAMADDKAHIMISVNSIIISIVLGLIVRNLDDNRNLIIPTIILLLVSVTAIIYSVLATRPKVLSGIFTQQQVENKTVNLMFFGSFYKMGFKEYEDAMTKMMQDNDFLYGSLIKDLYWQGRVLGRKYRLLRTSYSIFMYGLVASVIAFAIAEIFFR